MGGGKKSSLCSRQQGPFSQKIKVLNGYTLRIICVTQEGSQIQLQIEPTHRNTFGTNWE